MASYTDLRNEGGAAAGMWNAETMSDTMKSLTLKLIAFYKVPAGNIGAKGDNSPGHMRGAHRSRNWIKNSSYCTNRTYTVSETPGNKSGGDGDWLAGMDITVPREPLLAMCKRLDVAVRSGRLEKITEWYGNSDGDTRVDGYNNIENRIATSDSSHLWHLHITFDRGRANEDHTDLYAILTGEDDMTPQQANTLHAVYYYVEGLAANADPIVLPPLPASGYAGYSIPNVLAKKLAEIDSQIEALKAGSGLTYEQTVAAAEEGANKAEDS